MLVMVRLTVLTDGNKIHAIYVFLASSHLRIACFTFNHH